MNLFCLPYAGASAAIYYRWKKYLEPEIKLFPIELAGRGRRFSENFYKDIFEASDDVFYNILPNLNENYAIYGHSMGGTIAYEVYKRIIQNKKNKPCHMFLSSCTPPNGKLKETISNLSDSEFLEKMLLLKGISEELIDTLEFKKIYFPILRNDIKILEGYKFDNNIKIECPVTVLTGDQEEPLDSYSKNCFERICSNDVAYYVVPGNHFFVNTPDYITSIIKSVLNNKNI